MMVVQRSVQCAVVCAREMVGNSYRYWDKLRVGCTPRQNESSQNPLLGRLGPGAGWPESGKLAYSSIGIPCLSDLLTNSHTNTLIPVNHRIRGGWEWPVERSRASIICPVETPAPDGGESVSGRGTPDQRIARDGLAEQPGIC